MEIKDLQKKVKASFLDANFDLCKQAITTLLEKLNSIATYSAVSPISSMPYNCFILGFTKRHPIVVSWTSALRENAEVAFAITKGERDIPSTPPAIIKIASPDYIVRAALPIACMPEAHRRLTDTPGTESGRPAKRSAIRPIFRLSSPDWFTQP